MIENGTKVKVVKGLASYNSDGRCAVVRQINPDTGWCMIVLRKGQGPYIADNINNIGDDKDNIIFDWDDDPPSNRA